MRLRLAALLLVALPAIAWARPTGLVVDVDCPPGEEPAIAQRGNGDIALRCGSRQWSALTASTFVCPVAPVEERHTTHPCQNPRLTRDNVTGALVLHCTFKLPPLVAP